MAQFGNADSGFFTNSQTTVACQFITCCTINQCGVIIPDSGCCSSVRCGVSNCASGFYSAALGGQCNIASGILSTISGGVSNVSCYISNIGGGQCNTASGIVSTVSGGYLNVSSGNYSIVSGGRSNTTSGNYSTIGGGFQNITNSCYSAIVGGQLNNTCGFANSFIVGSNLCATQVCTTFTNCLSANNLTAGCFVCVGANKVLENSLVPYTRINYGLFAQTANSTPVTATAVETSIIGAGVGTLTVPANAFSIGDSFLAVLDGVISCVGTATLEVHVKTLTGVVLADTGVIAMDAATLKSWTLNLYFTVRTLGAAGVASISSGGLFGYIKNSGVNFEGTVLSYTNITTFNTTINNTLEITMKWNTNNAGNSIQSFNFVLNKIY
jgi:hypothetical protein